MIVRKPLLASSTLRMAIVFITTAIALELVYIFHWVLGTGIVFTHFFYLPIILSVIWFRKKGLLVALLLVAALNLSDLLRGDLDQLARDLPRGLVMLGIAAVVHVLNERSISSQQQITWTNQNLERMIAERTEELRSSNENLRAELERRTVAETMLAQERNRLEITLRSIGDGVIATDLEDRIVMMNPVAETLTGWSFLEAEGRPLSEVVQLFNDDSGERLTSEPVLEGRTTRAPSDCIVLVKRSGGRIRVLDSRAPIVLNGRSIGAVTIISDITERERLKEELWQDQRYHSIELLAGGVAHDFGNFLISLSGNLELLRMNLGNEVKANESISRIERAMQNAHGLTKQLMTFSRIGSPSTEGTDIRTALGEIARFNLAGSEIGLELNIDPDLSEVYMDTSHLSQVVGNIIINAKQAMEAKGTVRLMARNKDVTESDRLKDGHYVMIDIIDDGPGMPEDVVKDVFEPYFTKKMQGAGLGMAITKYIITKHDGTVEVESVLGKGTKFTLYLPAASCQLR
ncbi:MAG: nitrogen regulation protein NR(II) [Methanomassiliicoccales archaeon]